jgi:ATP-dependent helicase HepA
MGFDTEAVRDIEVIPYDMEDECNNTEYSIYLNLVEWIENSVYEVTSFKNLYLPVIKAFFSSSIALLHELEKIKDIVPAELAILTRKWNFEENLIADNITDVLEKSDENYSRLVSVIDYLDQELYDKKTLIFTDYQGTFELYKNAIVNHFGDEYCCFFNKNMSVDELELNVYRFQTDDRYKIMLSDKSGGEGRNFQIADALIHIDLPWSANDLEQRIGRLDRIGREKDKPVISVVCCAQNTVEQDLFGVWNDGLKIFSKSQSGLEIIMPEIDEQIIAAFSDDLKYGVHSIVNDIVAKVDSLQDIVKRERHFDVAQYKYQTINKSIERTIQRYRTEETELFALSMMSWAQLTGFKGRCIDENTVQFMPDSFSMGSAYNTWFIPPDMKKIIDDKMNQMQNRVREMSNNKKTFNNSLYILGTFSREQALKSDYLHFFAPGDEIYDSITQNALRTYKGKCTAIAVIADIRWEGFIYSWNIEPDILSLLENDIPLRKIEQYKGFIPSEPVLTAVSVADDNNGEDVILGQFAKLQNMSMSEIRSKVAHLGRRGKTNDFLKIKAITGLSNLEYFKQAHPSERWQYNVQRCFKIAKDSALKKYKGKIKFKELKAMLYNQLSEDKAAVEFYGGEFTNEADDMVYRIINEAFCKSKITLDSVCYVKMIRGRDNG